MLIATYFMLRDAFCHFLKCFYTGTFCEMMIAVTWNPCEEDFAFLAFDCLTFYVSISFSLFFFCIHLPINEAHLQSIYIWLYCCQQKHLPPASVYITANQKINYPHDSFVSNLKDSIWVYLLNYACVEAAAVPKW